jgi:hypothetical protein
VGVRDLRVGLVVVVTCVCAVFAQAASAVVERAANGHRVAVMVRPSVKSSPNATSAGGALLVSHGGPVLQASAPYLIYWAPAGHPVAAASQALLDRYLGDVATDSGSHGSTTNVYSVLGQYGSPYSQTFGGSQVVEDTNPYPVNPSGCKLATGMTACVTDGGIQTEIARLIDAGQLPKPSAPGASSATPIFFMVTPVDVNVCLSGGACVNNNFCAYHDDFTHNGASILYASVPFSVFAASTKGCQTDQYSIYETPVGSGGDEAYNIADDLSHELSETITDPLINAWYTKNGYEVGDLCEAYGATADPSKGLSPLAYSPAFGDPSSGTLYDQVINHDQYYNQTEYSNSAGGCRAGITALK